MLFPLDTRWLTEEPYLRKGVLGRDTDLESESAWREGI
jgi:hypothetical protein